VRVRGQPRYWIAAGIVMALCAVASFVFGRADPMKVGIIFDIDQYPIRTKVNACANPLVSKPGVADFRALLLSQVGGGDDGLAVCKRIANASGSYSDHADGRAWDWRVKASSATDRAMVDRVLNWLLRTDERGKRNAMARRLGITYIIWNHLIYRVGGNDTDWVPYNSTTDPHDTHVHFSFSVAGATRQTSWWTERGPLVWMRSPEPNIPLISGAGARRPLAGDWDGDGRDTVGVYNTANRRFLVRGEVTSGGRYVTTPPVGPFGAIPFAGDWDGAGGDEVGVYEPLARRFYFYSILGAQARASQVFGAAGDLPIVGDWDGDGIDDIGTYAPGGQTFSLLLPDGSVRTESFGTVNDTPVVGDWNGDGVDDIGAFRSSDHTFLLDAPSAAGSRAMRSVNYGPTRHLPVIGDWDGNGTDNEGIVTAG
jgi:hypothetical protein